MLELREVDVSYGDLGALSRISLSVMEREIVSIVGANAAGKSTILRVISGLMSPGSGEIRFRGERIDSLPAHVIVRKGIVHVPEGRRLFAYMTVLENLQLGAYAPECRKLFDESLEAVYHVLPTLKERGGQLAGSLSGGEQQMLAIGRGLMARPRLLMLDEPSLGLAPLLVRHVFEVIEQICSQGTTILLVEQNVHHALTIASRGYVLENGRIVLEGPGKDLLDDPHLKRAYLGMD